MKDKCILLVAHISNDIHVDALNKCIDGIKNNAPNYPTILSFTGDLELIKDTLKQINHYVVTNINTLDVIHNPFNIFYTTENWSITYTIPSPRNYYGFAQLQKTAIGLQSAMALGYKHFLVMNYDATIMDEGFVDYMFSEKDSLFFNFEGRGKGNRFSTDVFKLDTVGALKLIELCNNKPLYNDLAEKDIGFMLEDVLGEAVLHYKIKHRKLIALRNGMFQLFPFKILINNSFNEGAMAAVVNDMLFLLVTDKGHPRYTLDGKMEIGCNGIFTTFDVSANHSTLFPITKYEGKDVDIIVRTSFGESKVRLRKEVIENSNIVFN